MSSVWSVMLMVGMMLGVGVSISSGSWLGVWMGLELNLLCFIPMLVRHQHKSGEISLVYFLIQACGSFIILMTGINIMNYSFIMKFFISMALLLKVGAAPFHFWYVWVASDLSWVLFVMLSTLQKVAPLVLMNLSEVKSCNSLIYMSIILCGVTGSLGGVGSLSYRKILVYSSINHLGWVLIPLVSGSDFWISYFCVYCILLISVVSILLIYSIFHISQFISISFFKSLGLLISMMSLMGFPPMLGFLPKWGVFVSCVSKADLACLSIMILSSVISAFFYIRASFISSLIGSISSSPSSYFRTSFSGSVIILLNLLGFWLSPILV